MTSPLPYFSFQLSASIFATVALRTEAAASCVVDSTFTIERPQSHGVGTILPPEEVEEVIRGDFPPETIETFLRELRAGRLNRHRYDLQDGGYRVDANGLPLLVLGKEEVLARQDPIHPDLRALRPPASRKDVFFTRAGIFLENLPRIDHSFFREAVFRALGNKPEPKEGEEDLLWIHARGGELLGPCISAPLVIGVNPPSLPSTGSFRRAMPFFPIIPMEFRLGLWEIQPRRVIAVPKTTERVLSILEKTSWPIRIFRGTDPKTGVEPRSRVRHKKPTPPPKPKKTAPFLPVVDEGPAVSEMLSDPLKEIVLKGRGGIVSITRAEVLVSSLNRIPKEAFDQAVSWCLGVRRPREGEPIILTAGVGFAFRGRIRDCLFVSSKVHPSRESDDFPKVRVEFRNEQWVLLPRKSSGRNWKGLMEAVLKTDWGLEMEKEDSSERT